MGTNKIKLRYGTNKSPSLKQTYENKAEEDEMEVVVDEEEEPVRKIVWDSQDYKDHPYQFKINFTPLRLTALTPRKCDRQDFKTYSEIDQLLNLEKEEVEEKKDEADEFRPEPKLQKLTMFVRTFWPDWWG